jgi:cytochrome c oxidase cbb3-type subunit 3
MEMKLIRFSEPLVERNLFEFRIVRAALSRRLNHKSGAQKQAYKKSHQTQCIPPLVMLDVLAGPLQIRQLISDESSMMQKNLRALCAVLFIGAASAWADDTPKYDAASVERGKQNFGASCGICHGASGKGGEKGPDLLRSVLVLHDEGGKSIGPVILQGRPERGMPRFPLTLEQISDIAHFLHNSIEATKDRDNYKILNIVTGDAQAGKAYFNGAGKCAACHSVDGDLKTIGAKYDAIKLQTKMILPDDSWTEGSSAKPVSAVSITVTLPSGQSFSGMPLNVDDFTVSLREADGTYRSFARHKDSPRVEIQNKLQGHLDLLMHYTDADIHNLTAYLVTLK